jgi:hypothetical protein
VGLLKQSLAIVGGAGKGTAEVAKQIGLEQVFGQGGVGYRYEAVSVSDGVGLVQRTGDELLARAALAEKEDVDRQAEHPRQVIDDAAQAILAAHEVEDRTAESKAVVGPCFHIDQYDAARTVIQAPPLPSSHGLLVHPARAD